MTSMTKLLCGSAILLTSFAFIPTSAVAQGAAAPADSAGSQDAPSGNDIIVTATRRASPLSNVPIAVSAVTAASLQNSGANDIRQLNQLAPSLLVSSTGSEANGAARIRGVGTVGDNPGLESSVAVFIDGVYRSRTGAGLTDLGEIERIEVLRGPQGTLFGRNASAGLINIVTKSPSFTFGANGEVTYGNYDAMRVQAGVTGPISDTIALRLDGLYSKRDGFLKEVNRFGGKVGDTNDRNRYMLRGQALLEPNDALSIRLIADYTNRDESCCGAVYTGLNETLATGGTQPNRIVNILSAMGGTFPSLYNPYARTIAITPGRDYVSRLKDWGVSAEINYDLGGAKLTSITAYRDYKSRDYGDYDYSNVDILYRDPNTSRQFRTFTQELRLQGSAFDDRLDWLVGGYFASEKLTLVDNIRFGADYGRFMTCRILAGSGPASALPTAAMPFCGSALGTAGLIAGLPAPFDPLKPGLAALAAIPAGSGDIDARYRQKSTNWAIFTHNIFHVTSNIDLTVGLRYTHESKKLSTAFVNNNATCAALQPLYGAAALGGNAGAQALLTAACLGNASTGLNGISPRDSIKGGQLSGTGVLSWKPTSNLLVYASYSRGYKAGGFNLDRFELGNYGFNALTSSPATYFTPRTNADGSSLRFAPETVNAFEIGAKLSGSRWNLNLAIFQQAFKNFQLNTFNGTSFVVQNINGCKGALNAARQCLGKTGAGLVSRGFEIEAGVSPARNFRVGGGFTYTRSKFANRLVASDNGRVPLDPALFLLHGNINSNAPKIVTTANVAWTPDIGSSGLSALFYVDGRMTSDYNTGSDLFPEKNQDGYTVVNARIGLRGPDQKWALEFWGQNIFNTKYTQVTFNSPLQGAGSTAQLGTAAAPAVANQLFSSYLAEPRTYGITLRGRF